MNYKSIRMIIGGLMLQHRMFNDPNYIIKLMRVIKWSICTFINSRLYVYSKLSNFCGMGWDRISLKGIKRSLEKLISY